jgi:hypothetical protein
MNAAPPRALRLVYCRPQGNVRVAGASFGLSGFYWPKSVALPVIGKMLPQSATAAASGKVTTNKVYFSTGTAPANGAAKIGTQVGNPDSTQNSIAGGTLAFANGG